MKVPLFIAALMIANLAMGAQFTCACQLAGYAYERSDERGPIDYGEFTVAFDRFPWMQQLRKREELGEGCSATLEVSDHERHLDYWVSIANRENQPVFLLGIVYDKEVERWFGLLKPRKIRWVEIYVAPSRNSVLSTFRLFFSGHTEELKQTLRTFEAFDQMEAWNPKKDA